MIEFGAAAPLINVPQSNPSRLCKFEVGVKAGCWWTCDRWFSFFCKLYTFWFSKRLPRQHVGRSLVGFLDIEDDG